MILWLASYPRSGNTLLRTVLNENFGLRSFSLYDDTTDIGANEAVSRAVGHESHNKDPNEFIAEAKASTELFLVKTHDAPQDDSRAIYVVRDGRASVVSYYHYMNKIISENGKELRDIIVGDTPFDSWSDHYWSWMPQERPNTLLLRYEDLTQKREAALEKIGAFLGMSPSRAGESNFGDLQALDPKFFRSGSNDRNIDELSDPGDVELFWALHGNLMQMLGYGSPPDGIAGISRAVGDSTRRVRAKERVLLDRVNRAEAVLLETRALAQANQDWAERSDDAVATSERLLADTRIWAENTDKMLVVERERLAGATAERAKLLEERAVMTDLVEVLSDRLQEVDRALARIQELETTVAELETSLFRRVRRRSVRLAKSGLARLKTPPRK